MVLVKVVEVPAEDVVEVDGDPDLVTLGVGDGVADDVGEDVGDGVGVELVVVSAAHVWVRLNESAAPVMTALAVISVQPAVLAM